MQIDAHKDLRQAFEGYTYSHASVFYSLLTSKFAPKSLVQVGIRDFCQEEQSFAQSLRGKIFTFYDRYLKMLLYMKEKHGMIFVEEIVLLVFLKMCTSH